MKSILQPIKPQYCELIVSGRKTIEVRKTRPKLQTPFKVYIYETKGGYKVSFKTTNPCVAVPNGGKVIPTENGYRVEYFAKGKGKVIGEYVCDKIIEYPPFQMMDGYIIPFLQQALCCLSQDELWKYGKGKPLYGWHISDLKIYDKPRELSEFYLFGAKCRFNDGEKCTYKYHCFRAGEKERCGSPLTHPPQSWCYVEEVR